MGKVTGNPKKIDFNLHSLLGFFFFVEAGHPVLSVDQSAETLREPATGGFYDSAWGHHSRLQILTIGELLEGKGLNMPPFHRA